MALAVVQQKGENLPAQLDGVSVTPFDESLLALALSSLEEPIHGRAMHRDRAEPACVRDGCSLLHLPDHLPLGRLALFWGDGRLHSSRSSLLLSSRPRHGQEAFFGERTPRLLARECAPPDLACESPSPYLRGNGPSDALMRWHHEVETPQGERATPLRLKPSDGCTRPQTHQ